APLAIVTSAKTERAAETAQAWQQVRAESVNPPVLLLTGATADRLMDGTALLEIYKGLTFRLCFTNRQIARAVADFVWWRRDLRPDRPPVYLACWNDDPYS